MEDESGIDGTLALALGPSLWTFFLVCRFLRARLGWRRKRVFVRGNRCRAVYSLQSWRSRRDNPSYKTVDAENRASNPHEEVDRLITKATTKLHRPAHVKGSGSPWVRYEDL